MLHPQPPSCCAGLRPTLLQGWRQGLPLHPSPFRQMAARAGATPHELLRTCAALQREGALQPIHARWGAALPRERWRLFFAIGSEALARRLAALPGCTRIERCADEVEAPPWLWAELEVLDEAALQQQLAQLAVGPTARLRVAVARTHEAGPRGGPCADPQLAACLEQGLPLCAKPYAACARRLGRSERGLLACLLGWQRAGALQGLVLSPAPPLAPRSGWVALWEQAPEAAALANLSGVERQISGTPGWPWALSLVFSSAALPPLPPGALCLRLRIQQPRDDALLFQGPG